MKEKLGQMLGLALLAAGVGGMVGFNIRGAADYRPIQIGTGAIPIETGPRYASEAWREARRITPQPDAMYLVGLCRGGRNCPYAIMQNGGGIGGWEPDTCKTEAGRLNALSNGMVYDCAFDRGDFPTIADDDTGGAT